LTLTGTNRIVPFLLDQLGKQTPFSSRQLLVLEPALLVPLVLSELRHQRPSQSPLVALQKRAGKALQACLGLELRFEPGQPSGAILVPLRAQIHGPEPSAKLA
jgi:hypothetical protein